MELRTRASNAFRTRLAPNTGITHKQLATAIGCSPETIRTWIAEETDIKAKYIDRAARFLKDPELIREIYDGLVLDTTLSTGPKFLWFDDRGSRQSHHGDFAEAARRALNLPRHTAGDVPAYVRRNLGWVDVEATGEHIATIGYDDRGISLAAARAASDWLLEHRQQIDQVTRRIAVHGRIVERTDTDAEVAAMAIVRVAEIANLPQRVPWKVDRLDPGSLQEFQPLLKAWNQNRATIVEAAAALGLAPDCSLLRVSGTTVENISVGSAVELPHKDQFIGRDVMMGPDTSYREMVRATMLEAAEAGITVHHMKGSIIDQPRDYYRIAAYTGPETGIVLSYPLLMPSVDALCDATLSGCP